MVRKTLTLAHFGRHLAGQKPIGVFPLSDEGLVKFAAVDLDEPDWNAAVVMADLLPGDIFIEQSRSGNYHVFAFFSEPVEAWVVRGLMKHAVRGAGKERVEIFPKQDSLRPGMLGNYINLPYFGDTRPIFLPAVPNDPLSLEHFLTGAENCLIDPERWRKRAERYGISKPDDSVRERGTRGAPHECASYIIRNADDNPLQPGGRNVVLFNLAKMLLDSDMFDHDEVFDLVTGVNDAGIEPLPPGDIRRIVGSAIRGGYTSTGCDDPLMAPYIDPDCPIANGAREHSTGSF